MRLITIICLTILVQQVRAAGAVVGEPGSCMIEIGIYTAHFTIYQPDTRGNREYCEDLPDTGRALFVMDYLHGSLGEVPLEFRIIRDLEGWGMFARWEQVAALDDLERRTVFYRPASIAEGQLQVEVPFFDRGAYIGIVSAPHPEMDKVYRAVFPFAVARVNWLRWMLLAVLASAAAVFGRARLIARARSGSDP